MQKKFRPIVILLILLPAALFAAGFFSPKIKGDVRICGVSVSACTKKEAERKLADVFSEFAERELVFRAADDEYKLGAPCLVFRTDFDEIFSRALAVKKGTCADFPLTATYRLRDFPAFGAALAKRERKEAQNAAFRFLPDTPPYFFYTTERNGRAVDEYALLLAANQACEALSLLPIGAPRQIRVDVPYRALFPTLTEAALKNATRPLACYSTDYSASPEGRKHNVCLAAQKLSGAIVAPGKTLSFNQTVGARTQKNGFLPAKVIANGSYEMGMGGGVCQVSSTLYNAALLSGLTVTEWHPHSLAVSYVPPARDAMVSYGSADLVLRNDTGHPLFLVAETTETTLTFTFYGTPSGKTYALISDEVEYTDPPPPLKEWDTAGRFPTLKYGEERVVQNQAQGMRAACYLEISENGKTQRVLLRKSTYKPVQGRILIGTG